MNSGTRGRRAYNRVMRFALGVALMLAAACSGEPDCVIDSITKGLLQHEAGVRPRDDQTIVAVKVVQ